MQIMLHFRIGYYYGSELASTRSFQTLSVNSVVRIPDVSYVYLEGVPEFLLLILRRSLASPTHVTHDLHKLVEAEGAIACRKKRTTLVGKKLVGGCDSKNTSGWICRLFVAIVWRTRTTAEYIK